MADSQLLESLELMVLVGGQKGLLVFLIDTCITGLD